MLRQLRFLPARCDFTRRAEIHCAAPVPSSRVGEMPFRAAVAPGRKKRPGAEVNTPWAFAIGCTTFQLGVCRSGIGGWRLPPPAGTTDQVPPPQRGSGLTDSNSSHAAHASQGLPVGLAAQWACVLEATAPKPGNVHRGADFEDMSYLDMVLAASLIGREMEQAARGQSLGRTVLQAVEAIRRHIGRNTHLGTLLLLAPLARLPLDRLHVQGVQQELRQMAPEDAAAVYQAIRRAAPGGLGRVQQYDVHQDAPDDLLQAMDIAAQRDRVARQYTTGFADVFQVVVPEMEKNILRNLGLSPAIVHTYLQLLARWPDSLIVRKCGLEVAQNVSALAQRIVEQFTPGSPEYYFQVAELDFYLRSDGHQRNPGTTADLIAAGLFVLLRRGTLRPPLQWIG